MSEWRPIETAPKDGTEFLAWETIFGEKYLILHHNGEYWGPYNWGFEDREGFEFLPDCWMNLPDPPEGM